MDIYKITINYFFVFEAYYSMLYWLIKVRGWFYLVQYGEIEPLCEKVEKNNHLE